MAATEIVDLELTAPVTVECVARTEGTDRAVRFCSDKPVEKGGGDQGPMSSEMFGAAIAACHMTTARRVAEKRGVAYRRMTGRAVIHLEGGDIERVELAFRVDSDADLKAWDTVFRLAERSCTVARAVKCPIAHTVELAP